MPPAERPVFAPPPTPDARITDNLRHTGDIFRHYFDYPKSLEVQTTS